MCVLYALGQKHNKENIVNSLYSISKEDFFSENNYLRVQLKDGIIDHIIVYGTNDLFENDRYGKSTPVWFVDSLRIIKQNRNLAVGLLDARDVTFFKCEVPLYFQDAQEAIRGGMKAEPKENAYLWYEIGSDSTETYCIRIRGDSLLMDNGKGKEMLFLKISGH